MLRGRQELVERAQLVVRDLKDEEDWEDWT
jgi:hypothetical protein